jgi:hypothetical protein
MFMIDILLLVSLGLLAAATAILGSQVSLKPPARKQVARFRVYFWSLAIVSFGVGLVQGARGINASNDLAQALKTIGQNTERHAEFQMSKIESVYLPVKGTILAHNFYFKNAGSGTTVGFGRAGAYSFIGAAPTNGRTIMGCKVNSNRWWTTPGSQHTVARKPHLTR